MNDPIASSVQRNWITRPEPRDAVCGNQRLVEWLEPLNHGIGIWVRLARWAHRRRFEPPRGGEHHETTFHLAIWSGSSLHILGS